MVKTFVPTLTTKLNDYDKWYKEEKSKNVKMARACLKALGKSDLVNLLIDMKILKHYYDLEESCGGNPFTKKFELQEKQK